MPKIQISDGLKADVAAVKASTNGVASSGGGFNWKGVLGDALNIGKELLGSSSSSTDASYANIPDPQAAEQKNMLLIGGFILLILCLKK